MKPSGKDNQIKRQLQKELPEGKQIVRFIAKGGNGLAVLIRNADRSETVIKALIHSHPKARRRFEDEIKALKFLRAHNCFVSEILSTSKLDRSGTIPWYEMPLYTPYKKTYKTKSVKEICDDFFLLSLTLFVIHELEHYHRDIKLDNLLINNKNWPLFSDFGLATFKAKSNITTRNEKVGPRWTIAPEMERTAASSAPDKADIYSFGKTLWVALSRHEQGFEGEYVSGSQMDLRRHTHLTNQFIDPAEVIIKACCQNDPNKRPSAAEVHFKIKEWKQLITDHKMQSVFTWNNMLNRLFADNIPRSCTWNAPKAIDILNKITTYTSECHIFLPTGGGQDVLSVEAGKEHGSVEIITAGGRYIIFPYKIQFDQISTYKDTNYFTIESLVMEPVSTEATCDEPLYREEFARMNDGTHIPLSHFMSGTWPDRDREFKEFVSRYTHGTFILSHKMLYFNQQRTLDLYNGFFADLNASSIRERLSSIIPQIKSERAPDLKTQTTHQQFRIAFPPIDPPIHYKFKYLSTDEVANLNKTLDAIRDLEPTPTAYDSDDDTYNLMSYCDPHEAERHEIVASFYKQLSQDKIAEIMNIGEFGDGTIGLHPWDVYKNLEAVMNDTSCKTEENFYRLIAGGSVHRGLKHLNITFPAQANEQLNTKQPSDIQ